MAVSGASPGFSGDIESLLEAAGGGGRGEDREKRWVIIADDVRRAVYRPPQ